MKYFRVLKRDTMRNRIIFSADIPALSNAHACQRLGINLWDLVDHVNIEVSVHELTQLDLRIGGRRQCDMKTIVR